MSVLFFGGEPARGATNPNFLSQIKNQKSVKEHWEEVRFKFFFFFAKGTKLKHREIEIVAKSRVKPSSRCD